MQPVASAGKIFTVTWLSGQFHGVISPQTPIASLTISVRPALLLELVIAQHLDRGLEVPAAQPDVEALPQRGRRAHFLGHRIAQFGHAAGVFGLDRRAAVEPLAAGVCDQLANARRAAATALSTSAAEPSEMRARRLPRSPD